MVHMQMKLTFELNPNGTIATATFDNIYINTKIAPIALFVTEILKLQVSQICFFYMLVAMETQISPCSTRLGQK